jgi:hypothetical protein
VYLALLFDAQYTQSWQAGLEAFRTRTYELVPRGEETSWLHLDGELTELLAGHKGS